ncbi:MAG: hypothetical protein Q7K45_02295 [Nanoarchaeota archaeon]|nr:hypothetical protein [Nanoarchaeota archaeon]
MLSPLPLRTVVPFAPLPPSFISGSESEQDIFLRILKTRAGEYYGAQMQLYMNSCSTASMHFQQVFEESRISATLLYELCGEDGQRLGREEDRSKPLQDDGVDDSFYPSKPLTERLHQPRGMQVSARLAPYERIEKEGEIIKCINYEQFLGRLDLQRFGFDIDSREFQSYVILANSLIKGIPVTEMRKKPTSISVGYNHRGPGWFTAEIVNPTQFRIQEAAGLFREFIEHWKENTLVCTEAAKVIYGGLMLEEKAVQFTRRLSGEQTQSSFLLSQSSLDLYQQAVQLLAKTTFLNNGLRDYI